MRGHKLWIFVVVLASGFQLFAATGDACKKNADCGFGSACIREYEAGYCVKFDCSSRNPCDSGAKCMDIEDEGFAVCLKACGSNSDCRTGYRCYAEGVCLP